MKTTSRGLDLIKEFESFSPVPYLCPAGYWTNGWGHLLVGAKETWPESISQEDAEVQLAGDIYRAERSVGRLVRVHLSPEQFDALVSFTFNLGGGALQRSTLRALVNREEHDEVLDEFPRWVRAGGRVLKGLVRRRLREAWLYGSG